MQRRFISEHTSGVGVYLEVILGIPVRVKDNAGICCSQVDAESSSSRAQQEDKTIRVWSREAVDGCLPQVTTNSTIYTFIWISGHGARQPVTIIVKVELHTAVQVL